MKSRVKLYTTRACGYCSAAVRLLESKGIPYENVDVSHDPAARRWLVTATGRTTVPQIFIGDRSIGGYDDLRALERRGELDPTSAESPASWESSC